MTESQIKTQLKAMMVARTPGTVLHLLGEIFRERADAAQRGNDPGAHERAKNVESALFVVGMGVDAAYPT